MTQHKKLKQRIRARTDKTGESYTTARRQVVGVEEGTGTRLGVDPDTSALSRILADSGVTGPTGPLNEGLLLGIGGGLGAGYILWEFSPETVRKSSHHSDGRRRVVITGFRNRWQYPDRWADTVLDRLGVTFRREQTGSIARASQQLDEALASGKSVMADISVADLPYWHMPVVEAGCWGYPVAVTGVEGGRYVVDDRSQGKLTVEAGALSIARNRIPSYKNRIVMIEESQQLGVVAVTNAIEAGL
ncbi:MAG TPA: BtrH N-terminal domain-containing protein, partial [Acidimicrobiia bacterium]